MQQQAAAASAPTDPPGDKTQTDYTLSEADAPLNIAVGQLVAEYTSVAVIDAAWAAAHRLFSPTGKKAAQSHAHT